MVEHDASADTDKRHLSEGIGESGMSASDKSTDGAYFEPGWWAVFQRLSVPVLVYQLDDAGRPLPFTEVNDAALRLYGYSREELLNMSSLDLVDPEILDVPKAIEHLRQTSFAIIPSQHLARDGSRIPVEVHAHHFEMGGRPTIVGVCLDVSRRAKAEAAVLAREEELVQILEGIHDSFVALNRDLRVTYCNARAAASVGSEPAHFIGKHIFEEFPAYLGTPFESAIQRALDSGEAVSVEALSPITDRWLEGTFNPTPNGISIFARDVSERKRAALVLTRQSEQAREMAEAFTEIASAERLEDKLQIIADRVRQIIGAERAAIHLQGENGHERAVSPRSPAGGPTASLNEWETRQIDTVLRENRLERSSAPNAITSGEIEGSFLGAPLSSAEDLPFGAIVLFGKVSGEFSEDDEALLTQFVQFASSAIEAVRAERARLESESRFRTMANAAPVLIWRADTTKACTWFNRTWLEFTGRGMDEEIGNGWTAGVHAEDYDGYLKIFSGSFDRREPFQMEYRLRHHNGEFRWLLDQGTPLYAPDGTFTGYIGSCTDVHDRVMAQEQLEDLNTSLETRVAERTRVAEQQALQLRHLAGQLTRTEHQERRRLATILHDHLQQLLVASKFGLSVISQRLPEEERPMLEQSDMLIGEAIEVARSLTAELTPPVLYEAGLKAALEWLMRWMKEKHGVSIIAEIQEGTEPRDDHVRVVMFEAARELLFNVAKHAQTDSAMLCLSNSDNGFIEMTIQDRGVGFDPEKIAQQDLLVGGVGLRSIEERVGYIGGRLEIASLPGSGTTVSLLAPAEAAQAADGMFTMDWAVSGGKPRRSGHVSTSTRPASSRPIRVLVADDHRILREGLTALLSDTNSIEVVGQANDGQMAIDMARMLRPDVVIMDITMPNVNGIEATRRIMAELPDTRVVGLSMHTEADMAAALHEAGARIFLTKGGPVQNLIDAILDNGSQHS